jgi:pimeloyl-ACP methyl ester carboxylesterase
MPGAVRAALAAAALLALAPGAAVAADLAPCKRERGFDCATLNVPLDRSGALAGTIGVRYAVEHRKPRGGKVLLALTGGPGQNGVPFASSFADDLSPALEHHRLLVLDQRGTGRSGLLSCPEIQGLIGISAIFPEDVAGCARRLGPGRDHYGTIDTVEDIEAVRRDLGVAKLAIYGVSYGTWVALQYARRYPEHVERLVLDSVEPPTLDDTYDVGVVTGARRMLTELCRGGACRGITADPLADLTAVVDRMRGRRLHATIRDANGGRRDAAVSQFDLLAILVASDLNSWLRARLPGALAAARAGDAAPLVRLRRDAGGPSLAPGDLSGGLFVATICADTTLPYALSDPLADRPAKADAALAALPAAAFAPFDRATLSRSSAPQICLQWPRTTAMAQAPRGPLPDVPVLLLSGRVDTRTPLEGARETAAAFPRSTLVPVAGAGHDVLSTDATGCVRTALRRFFTARAVGRPCRGKTNAGDLAPVPPRRLSAVRRLPGVAGDRGRVARAVLLTLADAWTSDNSAFNAGYLDSSGGGLRGGRFEAVPTGAGDLLILHDLSYVPGVRVTGPVFAQDGQFTGRLRVRAPGGLSGRLTVGARGLSGTLGGKRVHAPARAADRVQVARAA